MSKNNKASTYNEKMLTRLRIQFIVLSMAVVIIMQGFIVYTSVRNTYNKMVAKSDHLVSSININILDNKILCEDVILFNMHSREELKYKFFQEYDYLNNTKLYINNSDNFYSTSLKMDLLKGYINIDKRLLNGLKITDKNVTIKLTYELDLDYITSYTNTDVLPLYMDLENIDYLNNLTINSTNAGCKLLSNSSTIITFVFSKALFKNGAKANNTLVPDDSSTKFNL